MCVLISDNSFISKNENSDNESFRDGYDSYTDKEYVPDRKTDKVLGRNLCKTNVIHTWL